MLERIPFPPSSLHSLGIHTTTNTTLTMTEAALRRSGRERKQVESVYSDAQKVVAAEKSKKKKTAARGGSSR
jgi:hypothetical protein